MFAKLDTKAQKPKDRFEYWRSLHPMIDMDPADKSAIEAFKAQTLVRGSDDGTTFGYTCADDTITRFARSNGEFVLLSLTVSGDAAVDVPGGGEHAVRAGREIILIDGSRPMTTRTFNHAHLYVTLPLDIIRGKIGSNRWPPRDGIARLPYQGLVPFLVAQMQMFAENGPRLEPADADRAMEAMKLLALGVLDQQDLATAPACEGPRADALFSAAQRYIALNFGDLDLTAGAVAAALGCSRSQLYRIYQDRNSSVGSDIRTMRLQHAKLLLLEDLTLPNKLVAYRCGYRSVEAFIRAFKEQSGQTPQQFRANHSD
ncbi:helix-turn-helix transcriptional regulator [Roseibium sp.]|uniref:helix-turn-helix transcriptional regulator n=1 Tax=Roseibium sp. TaxID=1936156 RepID=UPI003D0FB762